MSCRGPIAALRSSGRGHQGAVALRCGHAPQRRHRTTSSGRSRRSRTNGRDLRTGPPSSTSTESTTACATRSSASTSPDRAAPCRAVSSETDHPQTGPPRQLSHDLGRDNIAAMPQPHARTPLPRPTRFVHIGNDVRAWTGTEGRLWPSVHLVDFCSTSVGMRPRAGTAIPFSVAQARITLGLRVPLAERVDDFLALVRRVASPLAETGRPTFQYLSTARDREARFLLDRSSSRQSPFHPSITDWAPSDPSRSSISTSTVVLAPTSARIHSIQGVEPGDRLDGLRHRVDVSLGHRLGGWNSYLPLVSQEGEGR
jgi:hypothetical protein